MKRKIHVHLVETSKKNNSYCEERKRKKKEKKNIAVRRKTNLAIKLRQRDDAVKRKKRNC